MAIRRRVRAYARKWHRLIGPREYSLHIHWDGCNGPDAARSACDTDEAYLQVHLHFCEKRMQQELKSEVELEKEIMHEVCHALIWPLTRKLQALGMDAEELRLMEESATTRIERAVWRATTFGTPEE